MLSISKRRGSATSVTYFLLTSLVTNSLWNFILKHFTTPVKRLMINALDLKINRLLTFFNLYLTVLFRTLAKSISHFKRRGLININPIINYSRKRSWIMSICQYLDKIEKLDALIKRISTGPPKEVARKLNISERWLYKLLGELRDELDCPIEYDQYKAICVQCKW